MSERYFTAILKNAKWGDFYKGSLIGWIYDDKNHRFRDGELVTTSTVKSIDFDVSDNIFYITTRISVYKVQFEKNLNTLNVPKGVIVNELTK